MQCNTKLLTKRSNTFATLYRVYDESCIAFTSFIDQLYVIKFLDRAIFSPEQTYSIKVYKTNYSKKEITKFGGKKLLPVRLINVSIVFRAMPISASTQRVLHIVRLYGRHRNYRTSHEVRAQISQKQPVCDWRNFRHVLSFLQKQREICYFCANIRLHKSRFFIVFKTFAVRRKSSEILIYVTVTNDWR